MQFPVLRFSCAEIQKAQSFKKILLTCEFSIAGAAMRRFFGRSSLSALLLLIPFSFAGCFVEAGPSSAQEMMQQRSRGGMGGQQMERGGGSRGGGMGGVGTGLGIGIGLGILQQGMRSGPASEVVETPRARTGSKKARKAASDKGGAPKFVGKPDNVAHDQKNVVGKLGDLNNHKQTYITKDGAYFRRHYYYSRAGQQISWFFYDVALSRNDRIISTLKSVPACKLNDDHCDAINIDNNPPSVVDLPPEVARLYEPPCEGAVLQVGHAYSVCVANANGTSTWHVRSDDEYVCPNGERRTYRTLDVDTGQACEANQPDPRVYIWRAKPDDQPCNPKDKIKPPQYVTIWQCAGIKWWATRYDVLTCVPPDGRKFIGLPSEAPPVNPNTDAGICNANDKNQRPPTPDPLVRVQ